MENFSELENNAIRVLQRWYEEAQLKKAQESKQILQELLIKEHRERCAAEEEWRKRFGGIMDTKRTGQVYYSSSTDSEMETDRGDKAFSGDRQFVQSQICDSISSPKIYTPQSSSEGSTQSHWLAEAKLESEASIHEKIRVSNFEVRAGTARTHSSMELPNSATPLRRQLQKAQNVLTPAVKKIVKLETTNCSLNNKVAQIITLNNKENMVAIGSGRTLIPKHVYDNLDWNSYTSVTRKLLQATFSRETLSTHSLSGRPSPAFTYKPVKKQLNRIIIEDIVSTVSKNCRIQEKFVRTCITVKCADEAKMLRLRRSHPGPNT